MAAGRCIDELSGNAHAVRRLADAAFQHVAHAQFAADLLHIDRPALVGEARIARDDEQPADARQGRDDVLDDAVGEIVLLGVAAQIHERQDGDRGPVRKGERVAAPRTRLGDVSGLRDGDFTDLADEAEALARDRCGSSAAPGHCRRSPGAPR